MRTGKCVVKYGNVQHTVKVTKKAPRVSSNPGLKLLGIAEFNARAEAAPKGWNKVVKQAKKKKTTLIVGHRGGKVTSPDRKPRSLSRARAVAKVGGFPKATTGVAGAGGYWPGMNRPAASVFAIKGGG